MTKKSFVREMVHTLNETCIHCKKLRNKCECDMFENFWEDQESREKSKE